MTFKKNIRILITFLTIMFLLLIFFITQPLLTGKTIQNLPPNDYTYTRAICNKTNFCQDNIIACKGNELISITPIINATIQHSENWKDPRNKTDFCE